MFRSLKSENFKNKDYQPLIGPPIGNTQLTPVEIKQSTYDYVMFTNPTNIAKYKFKKEEQVVKGVFINNNEIQFIFHDDGLVDPSSLNFVIEIQNPHKSNYLQLDGTVHSIIKSTKWELGNKIIEEIHNYDMLLAFLNDKEYNLNTYADNNNSYYGVMGGKEILLHPQVYGTDSIFNPEQVITEDYEHSTIVTDGMIDIRSNSMSTFRINLFSYIFNNRTEESINKLIPMNVFRDLKLTITLNEHCFFVPVFDAMVNDLVNGSYKNNQYTSYREHNQNILSMKDIKQVVNNGLNLETLNLNAFLDYFGNTIGKMIFTGNEEFDDLTLYVLHLTKLYGVALDSLETIPWDGYLKSIYVLFNNLNKTNSRNFFNLIDETYPNLEKVNKMDNNDVLKLFSKFVGLIEFDQNVIQTLKNENKILRMSPSNNNMNDDDNSDDMIYTNENVYQKLYNVYYNNIPNNEIKNVLLKIIFIITHNHNLKILAKDVIKLLNVLWYSASKNIPIQKGNILELFFSFDQTYSMFNVTANKLLNAVIDNSNSIVEQLKEMTPSKGEAFQSAKEYSILNEVLNQNTTKISREYAVREFWFSYDVYFEFCNGKELEKQRTFTGTNIPYYKVLDYREFMNIPPRRFYLYLYDKLENIYQLIYNQAYKQYPTYRKSNRYSRQMRTYWLDLGNKRYPTPELMQPSNTSSSFNNFVFGQLKKCFNTKESNLNNANTSLDINTSMYVTKKLNNAKCEMLKLDETVMRGKYTFGYGNEIIGKAIFGINLNDIRKTMCHNEDFVIKEMEIYMDSNIPLDAIDNFALYEMFTIGEGRINFEFNHDGSDDGFYSSTKLLDKKDI